LTLSRATGVPGAIDYVT